MKSKKKQQMDAWPTRKLREIAEIHISNVDKKVYPNETPVKLCNYMDVYANQYITCKISFMEASATPGEIERFRLQCGDVIITKDSETPDDIGIPSVVTEEIKGLVCGYHLALIRPNQDELDSIYLAKQLSTSPVARYFSLHASGSTRYGLPVSAIEEVEIPIPPKSEQTKIAKILSTVDRAIEKTEALIAKQQRIKTGLMQDLLTRGIDKHGNLRSEQTHKFKDSPLGRIPVEWEVKDLIELCDVTSSKRIFFSDYKTEGVPFYRSKEIIELVRDGFTPGELYIEESKFAEIKRKFGAPTGGDILISSVGTLGVCYLVKASDRFYFKDGNLIWLRSFRNFVNCGFLVGVLPQMIDLQFDSLVIGSSQRAFTIEKLKRMKLPQPTPNEQARLSIALEELESYNVYLHESFAKLSSLKTALMQDLLTGKRRVTDLLSNMEAVN